MRLSDYVELEDVREASRLMKEAIRTSAMDPRTGKIDMSLLNTGTGSGQRKMRDDLRKAILDVLNTSGNKNRNVKWGEVVRQLNEQSSVKVDTADFNEVVKVLENEGLIKVIGEREKRVIRKID
jgi:DNA replication licensing factor MCM4